MFSCSNRPISKDHGADQPILDQPVPFLFIVGNFDSNEENPEDFMDPSSG
jgi:hypothetical protein